MDRKTDIMAKIAKTSKGITTGLEEKDIKHWVKIYIMGRAYKVPADLTIMQAMEYAGYKFIRSCGCRAGFCGACATIYRKEGDYKFYGVLACQTRVENGMFLVQIPFSPAEKAVYDINNENYDPGVLLKYYPEAARCVSCNTCTKSCPQDLEVMDYVQAALKGSFQDLAELSFDCVQCGLCAMRCPAEIVQYHLAQFGRRMYGKYGLIEEKNVKKRVKEIEDSKYEKEFKVIMKLTPKKLQEIYLEQQKTREVY